MYFEHSSPLVSYHFTSRHFDHYVHNKESIIESKFSGIYRIKMNEKYQSNASECLQARKLIALTI